MFLYRGENQLSVLGFFQIMPNSHDLQRQVFFWRSISVKTEMVEALKLH